MSAYVLQSPDLTAPERPSRRLVGSAAVGFSLAWLAGLALPVAPLDVDASAAAALDAAAGEQAATAVRALLVLGLAGVALLIVAFGLARAVAAAGAGRAARVIRVAGAAAAGLSLAQLGVELVLAGPVAGAGDAGAAGALVEAVNRLDGAKMLALAILAASGAHAGRRAGVLPLWLGALGPALAVALVVSAAGYGLLLAGPAAAAFVSLPLLLVFITGTGLVLGRRR